MQEMWEMWVQSLGQEDPLEKGMATHPRILAWKIPWTEEPGWGCKELDPAEHSTHGDRTYIVCVFANIKFLKNYLFKQNQPTTNQPSNPKVWKQRSLEFYTGISLRSHQLIDATLWWGSVLFLLFIIFFFFVISILPVTCLRIKMWLLDLCSFFSCLNDIQSFPSFFAVCCCLVAELSTTLLWPQGL